MSEPNWKAKFKTRDDAFKHIFECIAESPGCAGEDGTVMFMIFGTTLTITPKKKKKDPTYESN